MRFSVPRMRPNCACRVFSTKLRIVVHDFMRQLLDQLLADRTILIFDARGTLATGRVGTFMAR